MYDERTRLLHKLQAEDFAVYEAVLYLDGHPDCRHALAYYCRHREIAARLRAEYEKKYGPTTNNNACDGAHWKWIDGPWPWEKEAN